MKVEVKDDGVKFAPVTLTITLESEAEMRALWHRVNMGPIGFKELYMNQFPNLRESDLNVDLTLSIFEAITPIMKKRNIGKVP